MAGSRRPLVWLAAAAALWAAAEIATLGTTVTIVSHGGEVEVHAEGATIRADLLLASVREIALSATPSIDPPGGRELAATDGDGVVRFDLPARFDLSSRHTTGDWWVDARVPATQVWRRPVQLDGPFTVRVGLRGRMQKALRISLRSGDGPALDVIVRRGLMDNDLFLLDGAGTQLAADFIDPRPLERLVAVAGTLLRALAAAALLLAIAGALALVPVRRPPRRPLPSARVAVVCLALAAAALSAWTARGVLDRVPHLPDSVVYLLQAGWAADGRLTGEASPVQEHLTVPFTYARGERWIGHYPPGWPLLLAPFLALGVPWLAAPLLALPFTVLAYLIGREVDSETVGVAAAALATVSPQARLMFGCYLSHALSAVLAAGAIWLVLRMGRRVSWGPAAAAGGLLGACFAVRPLTAVAVALPCAVVMLVRASRPGREASRRQIVAATAAGLVATVPTLVANQAITGNPLAFAYSLADGTMYGLRNLPFGIRNLDALLASTPSALLGWGWGLGARRLLDAAAFGIALVPLLRRRPEGRHLFLLGIVASLALLHLGARGEGLHGYGPRYYFDGFIALYVLAAAGFRRMAAAAPPGRGLAAVGAAVLFAVLELTALGALPLRLERYRAYYDVDGRLLEALDRAGVDRALVLLVRGGWWSWADVGPRIADVPDGDVTFADPSGGLADLALYYPDRPVLEWDRERLATATGCE